MGRRPRTPAHVSRQALHNDPPRPTARRTVRPAARRESRRPAERPPPRPAPLARGPQSPAPARAPPRRSGSLRHRPALRRTGHARGLERAADAARLHLRASRPGPVPAHLPDRHGDLGGPGCAPGPAARPRLAGRAGGPGHGRPAHDHAARRRRHRPAVDPGPPGRARPLPGGRGHQGLLLHPRRRHRPGLRVHALPRGDPGGGAAQPRHPPGDHRPHPGRPRVARPDPHHPAARRPGARARDGAGAGPQPGRVRGDHRLRRLQGGRHPHHAPGDLPGAGERHGHLPGAGGGPHRPVLPHRGRHEHPVGRRPRGPEGPTAPGRARRRVDRGRPLGRLGPRSARRDRRDRDARPAAARRARSPAHRLRLHRPRRRRRSDR